MENVHVVLLKVKSEYRSELEASLRTELDTSGDIGGLVCEDFQSLESYIHLGLGGDAKEIKSFLTSVSLSVWLAKFYEQKLDIGYQILDVTFISKEESYDELEMVP